MARQIRKHAGTKGNVLVETCLIFIAFTVMLIGIFDFGQFLFVHQALIERARYAARWAAVHTPPDTTQIQNVVLYFQQDAPTGATGYFGLTPSMVDVSTADPNTDNYRVNILIHDYQYHVISPYIAGTYLGPNIKVTLALASNF